METATLDEFTAFNEQLAALVEAGVPLDVGLGRKSWQLTQELKRINTTVARRVHRGETLSRQSLVYLCIYAVIASFVVAFLHIKIVPELQKIFDEFEIETPTALKWSIAFAQFTVNYWYLFALAIIALWWLVFSSWPGRVLRRGIFASVFRPLRELRIADVLQKLGVAAQAGRPVAGALSTLARYHNDPKLRNQLLFVRNEMEQGADVWQSMAMLRLLNPAEARALELAERLGNRPWVLRQLALVKKQRTLRRAARWSEAVMPTVIVIMGAFVLFQALAVFGTLIRLVYSLV